MIIKINGQPKYKIDQRFNEWTVKPYAHRHTYRKHREQGPNVFKFYGYIFIGLIIIYLIGQF